MTSNEITALILSQTAMLNAEIASMEAENAFRIAIDRNQAYAELEFQQTIDKYAKFLDPNWILATYANADDGPLS